MHNDHLAVAYRYQQYKVYGVNCAYTVGTKYTCIFTGLPREDYLSTFLSEESGSVAVRHCVRFDSVGLAGTPVAGVRASAQYLSEILRRLAPHLREGTQSRLNEYPGSLSLSMVTKDYAQPTAKDTSALLAGVPTGEERANLFMKKVLRNDLLAYDFLAPVLARRITHKLIMIILSRPIHKDFKSPWNEESGKLFKLIKLVLIQLYRDRDVDFSEEYAAITTKWPWISVRMIRPGFVVPRCLYCLRPHGPFNDDLRVSIIRWILGGVDILTRHKAQLRLPDYLSLYDGHPSLIYSELMVCGEILISNAGRDFERRLAIVKSHLDDQLLRVHFRNRGKFGKMGTRYPALFNWVYDLLVIRHRPEHLSVCMTHARNVAPQLVGMLVDSFRFLSRILGESKPLSEGFKLPKWTRFLDLELGFRRGFRTTLNQAFGPSLTKTVK